MLDEMLSGQVVSPRSWAYNFRREGEGVTVQDRDETLGLFQVYRGRVSQGPVIVADAAVAYFLSVAGESRPDFAADYPNATPPHQHFFVEAAGPKDDPLVAPPPFPVPRRWGWYFAVGSHEQVVPLLQSRGIEPHPALGFGVVGHLALSMRHHGVICTVFPLATAIVQVGADGAVLGPPLAGFPFTVDDDLIADYAGLMEYVEFLLHPMLFAVCLLNCPSTTTRAVVPRASKKKLKVAPSKRAGIDRPYAVMDAAVILDRLRVDGMAGIVGLPAAMATCRHLFPARFRPPVSTIVGPTGQPFWVPSDKKAP